MLSIAKEEIINTKDEFPSVRVVSFKEGFEKARDKFDIWITLSFR